MKKHKAVVLLDALLYSLEVVIPGIPYPIVLLRDEDYKCQLVYSMGLNSIGEQAYVPCELTLDAFVNACMSVSDEYVWGSLVFPLAMRKGD